MNNKIGIALKHQHFRQVLEEKPDVAWLEVHTENFFAPQSRAGYFLTEIRKDYEISGHSVGLSLGSSDGLSEKHLHKIKEFIDRYQPFLVSDHLSWGSVSGKHLNDLLPLPYTEESLKTVCENVARAQEFFGRKILVENPSAYIQFAASDIPEPEFMAEIVKRTGCGILLDLNNIYVTSFNHNLDAKKYLETIPVQAVGEMHLAGFTEVDIDGKKLLLDDHGNNVYPQVWQLYEQAVSKINAPTLIEWDSNVPELSVLLAEAGKAKNIANKKAKKNAA